MENNEKIQLLRRDDLRLNYTMDEIFASIKKCEEEAVSKFVDGGREDAVIMMWVKLNMSLVTDEQIEQVQAEYDKNGWRKARVERHEERGIEDLLIQLYF